MPEPSLNNISSVFVESARHIGVAKLLQVAAKTDLTPLPRREVSLDLFGVGEEIAGFASEVLPAYITGAEGTISIPAAPDLDTAIAAHLASRLLPDVSGYVFIPRGDHFDPTSTSTRRHCTVGCGIPTHIPASLCYDCRVTDDDTTNTQLVVRALNELGIDVTFAKELIGWSTQAGHVVGFPNQLFASLTSIAGTMSLAMNAWQLYLDTKIQSSHQDLTFEEPFPAIGEALQNLEAHQPIYGDET